MMNYKCFPLVLFFTFCLQTNTFSQDYFAQRAFGFSADFQQIRDELNYGLVFSGPQIRFSYKHAWPVNRKNLIYRADAAVGYVTSKGMNGYNYYFRIADVTYFAYERIRDITLLAGPWLKVAYNYQRYPDLQGNYSYHFTNYTLGFNLAAKYENESFMISFQFKNSLAGLISRPPESHDPYYYEEGKALFFKEQNRNFESGSFNLYNNSEVELNYIANRHPRIAYAYSFEYFTYKNSPQLDYIRHSFSVFIYPKSVK